MNRGASRRPIFFDDWDRRRFVGLLAAATESFPVEMHAYCLMDNHYHLLTRTVDPPLGEAMRFVGQQYTQYFNRRYGRDGALFRGRYHAELIEDDVYLLAVSRYIHRNPRDIDAYAPLQDYRWSSYATYVGRRQESWLTQGFTLSVLNGGRSSYQRFVEAEHDLGIAASQ